MKYLNIILDNFRLKAMTPYRICELIFSALMAYLVYYLISNGI